MKLPSKKYIYGILIVFVILTGLASWALLIEPNRLIVKNYKLELNHWATELNGFKIVAISDIHGGSNFIDQAKMRELVARTNEQEADLIVLLGDYLSPEYFDRTQIKLPLKTVVQSLSGLKSKLGVYVVLGNHDNEYGSEKIRREFEKVGYRVLENEAVAINYNGHWIRLLGTYDILKTSNNWEETSQEVKSALNQLEIQAGKVIVLTHNPDALVYMTEEFLISEDLALLLAGHTHGGQCSFPIIGAPIVPSSFGQKYVAGHIRDQGIDLFVNTGIGTSILPIRFGVPPEISVLELYQEN